MRFQTLRHLIKVLEKSRINLLICGRDWIFLVYNVEICIAVVCVNHNLYGVSDIVCAAGVAVNRLRVRVVGTHGIGIHHPVKFPIHGYHVRVGLVGKVRHYLLHPFHYISVNDYLRVTVNIGGNEKLQAAFLDREKHPVKEVELDACRAFIGGVLVALSVRIVKLFFVGIYNDIFIGKLAEINLGTGNFNFLHLRFRRNVSDENIRLSAAGNLVNSGQGHAVAVGIFQMPVQPRAVNFILVDFTGRQESLGIFSVDHVSVNINIVKGVVLTNTLGLVVKLLRRVEVVDSDIVYRFNIVINVRRGKCVVRRKVLNINIIQLVSQLGVFDISFQILAFFVDFVRRNHEILHQQSHACTCKPYDYHDYRNRKKALVFLSSHLHDEHDRRQNGQHAEDPVHPKGDIHIRKACPVNCAGVGVQEVKLTEEEIDSNHDEENKSKYGYLPRGDIHKLFEVSVIKLSFRLNRFCLHLLARKGLENL